MADENDNTFSKKRKELPDTSETSIVKKTKAEIDVPETSSKRIVAISRLESSGQGHYNVGSAEITADKDFALEITGSTLRFKEKPGTNISIGNFSIGGNNVFSNISGLTSYGSVNCGGVNMVTSGGVTTITKGSDQYQFGDNKLTINGITYKVYVPRSGSYKGKKLFLPEGLGIEEGKVLIPSTVTADEIAQQTTVKSAEDEKYKKRHRVEGFAFNLRDISCNGQSEVTVSRDILTDEMTLVTNGQSTLRLPDGSRIKGITATTNGQSSVKGNVVCRNLYGSSNGQSSIKGLTAVETCTVSSGGQSTISVCAAAGCSVDRDRSGQSTLNVTKVGAVKY